MTSINDAVIKLTYAVDDNQYFTLDTTPVGTAFDVIANIEVGANIADWTPPWTVTSYIRNLSQSTIVGQGSQAGDVPNTPGDTPWQQEVRVQIAANWDANPGDVLEAMTVLVIGTDSVADFSVATSPVFIAT